MGIIVACIGCGPSAKVATTASAPVPTPTSNTPPSTPTNLVAQALSATEVLLTWWDASNNETGFVIERKNVTLNQNFIVLTSTIPANEVSEMDTVVMASTMYAYRIKAINGVGSSAYSQEATALTHASTSAPAAPSNLTATTMSTTEIRLNWADNATDEDNFEVEQSTTPGVGFTKIATITKNTTTITVTNLVPDTVYAFRVRATNIFGQSAYATTAKGRTFGTGTAKTWVKVTGPPSQSLHTYSIWGTAVNDIWIIGSEDYPYVNGVYVPYPTPFHYDGTSWSTMSAPTNSYGSIGLQTIWGSSKNDVWALGVGNAMYHYDGAAWSPISRTPRPGYLNFFSSVWGLAANDVWATGDGYIHHYDGIDWTTVQRLSLPSMINSTMQTYDVKAFSVNDVWVVGGVTTAVFANNQPNSPVFNVDQCVVRHYDGTQWIDVGGPTDRYLYTLWGATKDDIWAAGADGTILHYDGGVWSSVVSPTGKSIKQLWGASANEVWGVGLDGTIIYYNGARWSLVTSPTTKPLTGIWGSSSDDMWAVGNEGTGNNSVIVLHYQ